LANLYVVSTKTRNKMYFWSK